MPTKNPRINITFEESTVDLLTNLANEAEMSVSSFAKTLILEALERREDVVLSAIAQVRDVETAKRVKHRNAWK